jgi:flavin-binding protein dodecin
MPMRSRTPSLEVTQMRGEIEQGKVRHYQVTLKLGATLED